MPMRFVMLMGSFFTRKVHPAITNPTKQIGFLKLHFHCFSLSQKDLLGKVIKMLHHVGTDGP
jgi:hypothetical protein